MFTALSDKQLVEVSQIIKDQHLAFMVRIGLGNLVDPADVKRLMAKGLISKSATDFPALAYEFGVLAGALEDPKVQAMDYGQFIDFVQTKAPPLTIEERAAVKSIKKNLAGRVKHLGDLIDKSTGAVIHHADASIRHKLTASVKKELIAGVVHRKAINEIVKAVRDATGEMRRNWTRVVRTELQNAHMEGKAVNILRRHPVGHDPKVFKRPSPDCCPHCADLYLKADKKTPVVFNLSDLTGNGLTNEGRKVDLWKATLGAVHPHCRCQLYELPEGWGFDNDGQMVPGKG